ncbi:MAG: SCO family protein [Ignavibacteria bacterium]
MLKSIKVILVLILILFLNAGAEEKKKSEVGIDEKLGEYVKSDLRLYDEYGQTILLSDLLKEQKPVILNFVYYRCPGICSPLLTNLAKTLDEMDIQVGKDFRVITVSFDFNESYVVASEKKKNYFNLFKKKSPSVDAWKFLTGDSLNIAELTDAVGFRYIKTGDDFIHPGVIVVLSPEQKITRYIYGTEFLPFDVKLALMEASRGEIGSTISRIVSLCYSYDAEGKKYVLNITRISGAVILMALMVFGISLFVVKKAKSKS